MTQPKVMHKLEVSSGGEFVSLCNSVKAENATDGWRRVTCKRCLRSRDRAIRISRNIKANLAKRRLQIK